MFLLRSLFWLGLAFILIVPRDLDLTQAAGKLASSAARAGAEAVAAQANAADCGTDLACAGGRAMVLAATEQALNKATPAAVVPEGPSIPLPRPRPDRAS